MISYYRKVAFLKLHEQWFAYRFRFSDILGFTVYWHVQEPKKVRTPMIRKISHTMELDLRQEMEEILAGYAKQTRKQTKTAETEGVTCCFEQNLDLFLEFYNDFARKRQTYLLKRHDIEAMGKYLELSFAKLNGEVVAVHSYLVDKNAGYVRHHHTATRRLDEQVDKNLIGRANKYLTTVNIQRYKERGFHTFDFGGYVKDTTDKGMQGFNQYKEQFGGVVVESRNYFSVPYWLFKQLARLAGMSGKL